MVRLLAHGLEIGFVKFPAVASIVHVKLEGLTVAQTAALTGMSVSAVKVGIHRGLKALAAFVRARR